MKWAVGSILLSALCIGGFFGVVILASESGEVITIKTQDSSSEWHPTRLWVVDHAGAEWTRTGHAEKIWFARLTSHSIIELERAAERTSRRAVPISDAAVAQAVNEAFSKKYGIADRIVALSGDASKRVVIRLDPVGL